MSAQLQSDDFLQPKNRTKQDRCFARQKLNPDTACFFARKHTHTQTQRRGEIVDSIIRALWKSGKRLQKITEKQPCIRKQLPDAAKQRLFQPYIHILHFCNDYVKGIGRQKTIVFLQKNDKKNDPGASAAPDLAPEGFPLWTPTGELASLKKPSSIRLSLQDTKDRGLLAHRKPGKSPGASSLSPRDYSLAFSGCKASKNVRRSAPPRCWAAPDPPCRYPAGRYRRCGGRRRRISGTARRYRPGRPC